MLYSTSQSFNGSVRIPHLATKNMEEKLVFQSSVIAGTVIIIKLIIHAKYKGKHPLFGAQSKTFQIENEQ